MKILFASIDGGPEVSSEQFVDIIGLRLSLPERSKDQTKALITLNVPNPYAKGNDYPGIEFSINVNGKSVATGCFTYSQKKPESYGRQPFTLVAEIPLGEVVTIVEAQWSSIRGSKGIIDSYANISAILGN